MNQIGSAGGVLVATAIFAAQVMVSTAWLARRRFGPVEALWRRLSYGRVISESIPPR
jgi:uncharacterized protein